MKKYLSFLSPLAIKIFAVFIASVTHFFIIFSSSLSVYGEFAFALALTTFLSAIIRFGLDQLLLKNNEKYQTRIPVTFLKIKALMFFLLVIVTSIFAITTESKYPPSLYFSVLVVAFMQSATQLLSSWLVSQQKVAISFLLSGLLQNLLFIFVLMLFDFKSIEALWTSFTLIHTFICLFIYLSYSHNGIIFKDINIGGVSGGMRSAFLFFVPSLAMVLTFESMQIILANYVSGEKLGILAISLKVSMFFGLPLMVINSVSMRAYQRAIFRKNIASLHAEFKRNQKYLSCFSALLVGCLILLSFIGIPIKNWEEIRLLLWVFSFGYIVNMLTGSANLILNLAGHEATTMKISICLSVIFVIFLPFTVKLDDIFSVVILFSLMMAVKNIIFYLLYIQKVVFQHDIKA